MSSGIKFIFLIIHFFGVAEAQTMNVQKSLLIREVGNSMYLDETVSGDGGEKFQLKLIRHTIEGNLRNELQNYLKMMVTDTPVGFPWSPALPILREVYLAGILEDIQKTKYQFKNECIDHNGFHREATAAIGILKDPICVSPITIRNSTKGLSTTNLNIHLITLMLHEHLHHFGYEDVDHAFYASLKQSVKEFYHSAFYSVPASSESVQNYRAFALGAQPVIEENKKFKCSWYRLVKSDFELDNYVSLEVLPDPLFEKAWLIRIGKTDMALSPNPIYHGLEMDGVSELETQGLKFLFRGDQEDRAHWLVEVSELIAPVKNSSSPLFSQLDYGKRQIVAFGSCR